MGINLKSNFTLKIALLLGNILVFLRPKKANELSENRITLIHKNKEHLSIQERLMRYALVQQLEPIEDPEVIAEQNRKFWEDNAAVELFNETENTFQTDFLPHCTFIFEQLKKELSKQSETFNTIVEIGTGNGDVLNYLSEQFPDVNRLIGIDLSQHQIDLNYERFKDNQKLEFVAADAYDWVIEHGKSNSIYVTSRGVLEYFLEEQLQELLNKVHSLGTIFFVAIEPNGSDHDFETQPNTQLYGDEPSFSHNYPLLFKNAGFTLWHFSQQPWHNGGNIQTFIGAKS